MKLRLALASIAVVAGCSGAPADDAGMDGGHDAGGDGGRDAGHDAGHDAWRSTLDARVPSLLPDDPGWTDITGFPDHCLQYALQPQAVLRFHWSACADGLAGCEWTIVEHVTAPVLRLSPNHGGTDARGAMVWILQELGPPVVYYVVLVHDDVVAFAWRAILCTPETTVNRAVAGYDAAYFFSSTGHDDYLATARWSDLAPLVDGLWQLPPGAIGGTDSVSLPSASETTFAGETFAGILVVEPPRWQTFDPGEAGGPVVIGHDVLFDWSADTRTTALHVASLDAGDRVLYTPPSGTHVYQLASDGVHIAWRAGPNDPTDTTFLLNELWEAPFTTDPAALAPRMLRDDIDPYCSFSGICGAIGDGMYALVTPSMSGDQLTVVSLDDGSRRRYLLPPHVIGETWWSFFESPLWVSRDEAVVPYARELPSRETTIGAMRLDLRSLPIEPPP